MATIRQILVEASQRIDRFDARLLLCFCLNKPRTFLIAHDQDELDDDTLERFLSLVARREKGEPFPYIVGTQEFFSRPFRVNPNVLIPRPDTETLIELVLEEVKTHPAQTLLDIGTGSGCIAITLALELPYLHVWATDYSEKALDVAATNASSLGANVHFSQGSWYDALPNKQRFDIIVSNPPYIESTDVHLNNLTFEPISALTDGADGLTDIQKIIEGAPEHLNACGLLAIEHGWDQGEAVRKLFSDTFWENVETLKDLGGNDRITKARLKN